MSKIKKNHFELYLNGIKLDPGLIMIPSVTKN